MGPVRAKFEFTKAGDNLFITFLSRTEEQLKEMDRKERFGWAWEAPKKQSHTYAGVFIGFVVSPVWLGYDALREVNPQVRGDTTLNIGHSSS